MKESSKDLVTEQAYLIQQVERLARQINLINIEIAKKLKTQKDPKA